MQEVVPFWYTTKRKGKEGKRREAVPFITTVAAALSEEVGVFNAETHYL